MSELSSFSYASKVAGLSIGGRRDKLVTNRVEQRDKNQFPRDKNVLGFTGF